MCTAFSMSVRFLRRMPELAADLVCRPAPAWLQDSRRKEPPTEEMWWRSATWGWVGGGGRREEGGASPGRCL